MRAAKSATLTLVLVAYAAPSFAQTTAEQIIGTWQTPLIAQPAPGGGDPAYVRTTISFTSDRELFRVEAFGEPSGTVQLFTYEAEGPYSTVPGFEVPGGLDLEGALAIDLENDRLEVEIFFDAPPLWQALNLSDCPLAIGTKVDISDCVGGPPFAISDCADYDLALVDQQGTRLRLGEARLNDCPTRPEGAAILTFTHVSP